MSKKYKIKPSKIHGKGVFAAKSLSKNEPIDVVIKFSFGFFPYVTSEFGSMINHSSGPNTHLKYDYDNDYWLLVASRPIRENEELVVDYNLTPWYIQPPDPDWD